MFEEFLQRLSRRIVSNLGQTYDTPPEKMKRTMEILREIVAQNDATDDKVLVSFNAFGDFAMNILFIYQKRGRYPRNSDRRQHGSPQSLHRRATRVRLPDSNTVHQTSVNGPQ